MTIEEANAIITMHYHNLQKSNGDRKYQYYIDCRCSCGKCSIYDFRRKVPEIEDYDPCSSVLKYAEGIIKLERIKEILK